MTRIGWTIINGEEYAPGLSGEWAICRVVRDVQGTCRENAPWETGWRGARIPVPTGQTIYRKAEDVASDYWKITGQNVGICEHGEIDGCEECVENEPVTGGWIF